VVAWLAAYCNNNAGRSKMQIQPLLCASHGGAVNVAAVALRLAAPFADPGSRKFMKIDPNYMRSARCRLTLTDVTRIAASPDEVAAGKLPEAGEPPAQYGFISECFFLAARAMHLGYIKCIAEHTALKPELRDREQQDAQLPAHTQQWASQFPGRGLHLSTSLLNLSRFGH
jgi:ubiquitin conjugation factor E4 B